MICLFSECTFEVAALGGTPPLRRALLAWCAALAVQQQTVAPHPSNGDHAGSDASVGVCTGRPLNPVMSIDASREP